MFRCRNAISDNTRLSSAQRPTAFQLLHSHSLNPRSLTSTAYMRSFLCLCILSLAASALSTPLETEIQDSSQSFNPRATDIHAHQSRSPVSELSQLQDKRLTNAERLARHYPLRRPHRRSITRKRARDFEFNAR